MTYGELWPTLPARKFLHNGYFAHFLSERDKIVQCWWSGQSKLIPRIPWTLVRRSRDTIRWHASLHAVPSL